MKDVKVSMKTLGRCVTQYAREDLDQLVPKFKQFAHFSQFSSVDLNTTEMPANVQVRIGSSPDVHYGEIMFGVNDSGSLTWLKSIIDSSD